MEITKDSWDALIEGQIRDSRKIASLKSQVESLSFKLEWAAREHSVITGDNLDEYLENLDHEWRYEKTCRDAGVFHAH